MLLQDRFRGCLLGLAAGDAVGTTVEFQPRGTFAPVVDMVGQGPFRLNAGQWTDDTSMALCLAASLLEQGKFDARDQMERYWKWYREGYFSSNGVCFDIGGTTRRALENFHRTGDPFSGSTEPTAAGNGSIMRLAPVVLFFYPDEGAVSHYAVESSRTTHGAVECVEACRLLGAVVLHALRGGEKREILLAAREELFASPVLRAIAQGAYFDKPEAEIHGTGYVAQSLEAALWCFWTTETFDQAVLKAANLGDDADTTAAICGQVAGAFYGEGGIPSRWLGLLAMRDEIRALADRMLFRQPEGAE